MDYQKFYKLPRVVASHFTRESAKKPVTRTAPSYKQTSLDIIGLYERSLKKTEAGKLEARHTNSERVRYVMQMKKKLGVDERELATSSRMSTHGNTVRDNYSYLEFKNVTVYDK